jgi:predicted metal-dependent hydrolase
LGRERGSVAAPSLPEYSVRVSARARNVRLVMKADRGLEVVIPRGFGRRQIPALVESNRDWIERAAARVEERRRRLEADPPHLPERIVLPALGEEWEVEYRRGGAPAGAVVRESAGRLVVTGDAADFDACRQALCRWLVRRARRTLLPRLAVLSYQHHLPYTRASVRQQRTRWGSCSRKKTVSLNARLLLVPAAAVDYILIHELCHTVEMNHSPRFWALVESHDSEYRAHKKLLRHSAKELPTWLDHEMGEPGAGRE